ncbi:RagB/SusD family nutrient uptake outer membrane protein [Labilibacter marinus]|uniref:RagB/SusD family nutrient uptake outer membrane protein n=1 Tax=Labilibacter marinus TaxID=1477105 RepID=UPI00082E82DF|nr:RagB/SusD family nutrient uptake outer membrane protein [Labilibacter marinus]
MKRYILNSLLVIALVLSFGCEDYLDKAPESIIAEGDVFKDFEHAQGFVEEMYNLIVEYGQSSHTFQDYLFSDETTVWATWMPSNNIDRGNLMFWVNNKYCYFTNNWTTSNKNNSNNTAPRFRPGVYEGSLTGIRKANLAIENIDLMIDATQDEKDIILGQAYFFRAFFHHEIMKFWGRYPYIKEVISDNYKLKRPETYRECALEADADFDRAIALLPMDWDDKSYGSETLGDNKGRINKITAYAMKGKNLLLAASPLMHFNNGSNINTYEYDVELCNMAVDAFAEVLKAQDGVRYGLVPFDRIEEVFWKTGNNQTWAGSTEYIFSGPTGNVNNNRWFMSTGMPKVVSGQSTSMHSPTHSFIYNTFGMANGLSIEDDLSGAYGPTTYDPTKPFENRDPRFYKWITIDGDVLGTKASVPAKYKIAQLYTGGELRKKNSSQSGYLFKKFYPTLHSKWNNTMNQNHAIRMHVRLTDVYLMYAEALHAAKGATTAPASYSLTAEQAINTLRQRAGVDPVNALIVADSNKFMDELRRDRSTELCFEAHRWVDIRRWGVAHLDKYKVKTALDFPQDHSYFQESVLIERVCDYPKHFWLPFEANQTQFYEGFPQNPGW